MKYVVVLIGLWIAGIGVVSANTQSVISGSCGDMNGLTVVYAKVDNMGYLPQPAPGSEARFNCIASRDPDFASRRFDSTWKAMNYWLIWYGEEMGQTLQPLPSPSN